MFLCTIVSPYFIVKSLQLRGRRQIAEPRKYCLVRVIVFSLACVFSICFVSHRLGFWLNSLQESHVEDKESHVDKNDANVSCVPDLPSRELMQYAYKIANMYSGLIVNLLFSSREHRESREFFHKGSSKDALRILEIELNFFYDILHTKVEVAYSRLVKISRFISIGLVVAALSLFYKEEKRGFKRFDIEVTYTMFLGVLGLDMVTLLLRMFSDWTIASFKISEINSHLASILSKIVDKLLNLRKPIYKQSER